MNGGKDTLHRGGNRPVKYAGSLYGGDQIHDDLLDSAVSRYIHCLLGGLRVVGLTNHRVETPTRPMEYGAGFYA